MKVFVLAGLFTAATVPFAAAAETTIECQLDDTRRAASQSVQPQPAAPAPTVARPTGATREAAADPAVRTPADRRRGGKPIPDAELIGPRGAL